MLSRDMSFEETQGEFYLGKRFDSATGEVVEERVDYKSRHLTTHAVCVGMTGSGKTGLAVGLLEEALLDGIPAIIVDPKGDLGNMLLNFPKLRPTDFEPWIDPDTARRHGNTLQEESVAVSELWKKGLAKWGQGTDRIQRLKDAGHMSIYTPASKAGLPITVLRSFDAPPKEVCDDPEAFNDKVQGAAAGILSLLGIDADPIQSREFILVSNLLTHAWQRGEDLGIPGLIAAIQEPPFKKLGVIDLDSFFSKKDRMGLALKLNGLLASPSFQPWMEGEPLDIERLMWTEDRKPRISIMSIAHLSDAERMFFVTILLNELVSWMRTQTGTSNLRALFFMDEIYGFFPPSKEPPTKRPMLTLLKQARAFGLGCVLATQNPVDLDYKGLSNCGTWFLGRLQTERDKLRVLDGLEGAMAEAGGGMDRATLDDLLSNLQGRVFLLHDVKEDGPVLFHTRWVMSYLAGPMTRADIERVMADQKAALPAPDPEEEAPKPRKVETASTEAISISKPPLPEGLDERWQPFDDEPIDDDAWLYRPRIAARVRFLHINARLNLDRKSEILLVADHPVEDDDIEWEDALRTTRDDLDWAPRPRSRARYEDPPAVKITSRTVRSWAREVKNHVYASEELVLMTCPRFKMTQEADESKDDFIQKVEVHLEEEYAKRAEKIEARFQKKIATQEERVRKAEQKLEKEEDDYSRSKRSSWMRVATSVFGMFSSKKKVSATNARRGGAAARSVDRVGKEKADIARAAEDLDAKNEALDELRIELHDALDELREDWNSSYLEYDQKVIRPRKSDIVVEDLVRLWEPWEVPDGGRARPLAKQLD